MEIQTNGKTKRMTHREVEIWRVRERERERRERDNRQ